LSNEELAALFKSKSIHAFLTLTHGEGYGLPILEAAACGLPVVATDWSGHLDFLTKDGKKLFVPVNFELKDIAPESVWKDVYEQGSKWAWPLESDAKMKMSKVVMSYDRPKAWAAELAEHVAAKYGQYAEDQFVALFDKLVEGVEVKQTQFSSANPQQSSFLSSVEDARRRFRTPGKKKLLYTMPQSAGDVYLSTGVVRALKQKFPDHDIIFATSPQYFSVLLNNPDIEDVIPWENWMSNVLFCEMIFDEVYTPNLDIQLITSNWIHGGKGSRKLAQEFAHRCDVEFQNPVIETIKPLLATELPEKYIAFHTTATSGKWSTRGYQRWEEVLSSIPKDIPIVQIGMPDEPLINGVDIDFRGKHDGYNQFAWLIEHSEMVLGVDTISMAFAAGFHKPMVTLFGSTYASKTGPTIVGKGLAVLVETPDRYTCEKACYKDECFVNPSKPCINNIDPATIVSAVKGILATR
jgi:ADP-heptose:LPS heptosyltransferase